MAHWWPQAAFHNALDNTLTHSASAADPLDELRMRAAAAEQNRLTSMKRRLVMTNKHKGKIKLQKTSRAADLKETRQLLN